MENAGENNERAACGESGELRRRAEQRLHAQQSKPSETLAEGDVRALLHELQVHQIEVELQNEELRAQAAAQLAAATRDLSAIFDAMPDGLSVHASDHTIVDVNQSLCRMLGKTKDEMVGRKCYQVFHGVDGPIAGCPLDKSKQTCRKEDVEFFEASLGKRLAVSTSPLADDAGCLLKLVHVARDVTERKALQDAVALRERRLKSFFRGATAGLAFLDKELRYVQINATLADMNGVSVEDHLGRTVREVVPHLAPIVEPVLQKVLATGEPVLKMELSGETPNQPGIPRDWLLSYFPIAGADGTPDGVGAIVVEITERKHAEAALGAAKQAAEASQAQYEQTVAMLSDVVWRYEVDGGGQFLASYISPVVDRLLGVPAGTISNSFDKYFSHVHPEDLPSVRERLLAALGALETETGAEYRLRKPDGTTLWVRSKGSAHRQPNGNIAAFGTTSDITESKRLEEALRASERFHRLFAENVGDMIWLLDLSGRFTYFSPSVQRILGYAANELLGCSFERIVAPGSLERARKVFAESVARLKAGAPPRPQTLEIEHLRKDGMATWIEVTVSRMCDEAGKVVAFQGVSRDITERRRMAEELRTAKNAAEAASRAKSEFLANMSHEIRTPMTAILGFSDLLASNNVSHEERRTFIEGIRRNGTALLDLINDILDLSRIEAEKFLLERTDYPLPQIMDDAISMVKATAMKKGLGVMVDYRWPLPQTVFTDPARLRQILVNLLGNAVKFTEQGEVRIAVRCEPGSNGSLRMIFAVSDTGIGIPTEKVDTLFQPFVQVDGSASRHYGGTGLGLAISKRLATALGGDIQCASELGKGSTFTLTIDAGPFETAQTRQALESTATAAEGSSCQELGPALDGRVLVVEDAPAVQVVLAEVLRRLDLQVEIADDGRAACHKAEKSKAEGKPYDLILMDIQMPRMNGYEATYWLRHHGWRGPIVALTAHAMVGDREKCLEAGCNDYLSKPLSTAELREVLQRYLGPAAVPQAVEGSTGNSSPICRMDLRVRPQKSDGLGGPSYRAAGPGGLLQDGPLDAETVARLVGGFSQELPGRARAIYSALQSRHWRLVSDLAHQLKGSAGLYGFAQVAEAARGVHRQAEEADLERLETAVAELVKLCEQA